MVSTLCEWDPQWTHRPIPQMSQSNVFHGDVLLLHGHRCQPRVWPEMWTPIPTLCEWGFTKRDMWLPKSVSYHVSPKFPHAWLVAVCITGSSWRTQRPQNSLTSCNKPASGQTIQSCTTYSPHWPHVRDRLRGVQAGPSRPRRMVRQVQDRSVKFGAQKIGPIEGDHLDALKASLVATHKAINKSNHPTTTGPTTTSPPAAPAATPKDTDDKIPKTLPPGVYNELIEQYNKVSIHGHRRAFPEKQLLGAEKIIARMWYEHNKSKCYTAVTLGELLQHRHFTATGNINNRVSDKKSRDHPHHWLRVQDPGRKEQSWLGPPHTLDGDGKPSNGLGPSSALVMNRTSTTTSNASNNSYADTQTESSRSKKHGTPSHGN